MYDWTYPPGYERFDGALLDASTVRENLQRVRGEGGREDIASVAFAVMRFTGEVRSAALHVLAALLRRTPSDWLDAEVDQIRGDAAWARTDGRLATAKLIRECRTHANGWSALGVLSFSHDGRIREAAVQALAEEQSGNELAFLIIRRADWVVQVREAAEAALKSRHTAEYAPHWARHAALLERVGARQRFPDDEMDRVYGLVRSSGLDAALELFHQGNRRSARAVAHVLVGAETIHSRAEEALLASPDPAIRLMLAKRLIPTADIERLQHFARDRYVPIAVAALDRLARIDPDLARPLLDDGLISTRHGLRVLARFHLSRAGVDVESRYAEVLLADDPPPRLLAAAIYGFGADRDAVDSELMRSFADHADRRVRRAAIRTLAWVSPGKIDVFVRALEDVSPRVARAGSAALRSRAAMVPLETLARLRRQPPHPHASLLATDLLDRRSAVRWGVSILRTIAGWKRPMRSLKATGLDVWAQGLTRDSSALTDDEIVEIRDALATCERHLPDGVAEQIHSTLDARQPSI